MQSIAVSIACVLGITVAPAAHAYHAVFDTGLVGTTPANIVSNGRCGITPYFPSFTGTFLLSAGFGVGNDGTIESGDEVHVILPAASLGVTYEVASASNTDGDGLSGESYLEAFDANGQTLGVLPVSGVGTKDVNALFGGAAITEFDITGGDDAIRVRELAYDLPPGAPGVHLVLGLVGGLSYVAAQFSQCGITFRGDPGLTRFYVDGVSVAGGDSEIYVDAGEQLEIAFDEPVLGASYFFVEATNVNGGTVGAHFVEAFDRNGASLGLRSASGLDTIDLSDASFYGNVPISRFVLIGVADQFRLGGVGFAPEPEGAEATAALALAWLVTRRRHARNRR